MSSEMQKFQQDLLESVRQMKRGEAASVTKFEQPAPPETPPNPRKQEAP